MTVLERRGSTLTESQQKQIFSIAYEEENPFYAPKQDDFTIDELVEHYFSCEAHWSGRVVGAFEWAGLQLAGLREASIDISGRGFIAM